MRKKPGALLVVLALLVVTTAALAGTFRRYRVASSSCAPTLLPGDLILANACAYDLTVPFTGLRLARVADPRPGDFVVYRLPGFEPGAVHVKRVVGVPGDVVELRRGRLIVNGSEVPAHAGRTTPSTADFGPATIEPGHYFLLSDNVDRGLDSRHFGAVPRAAVTGKVVLAPKR